MDQKADRKPFKGVRKEKQLPVPSCTSKSKKFDLHQSAHINYRSIYITRRTIKNITDIQKLFEEFNSEILLSDDNGKAKLHKNHAYNFKVL